MKSLLISYFLLLAVTTGAQNIGNADSATKYLRQQEDINVGFLCGMGLEQKLSAMETLLSQSEFDTILSLLKSKNTAVSYYAAISIIIAFEQNLVDSVYYNNSMNWLQLHKDSHINVCTGGVIIRGISVAEFTSSRKWKVERKEIRKNLKSTLQ